MWQVKLVGLLNAKHVDSLRGYEWGQGGRDTYGGPTPINAVYLLMWGVKFPPPFTVLDY